MYGIETVEPKFPFPCYSRLLVTLKDGTGKSCQIERNEDLVFVVWSVSELATVEWIP